MADDPKLDIFKLQELRRGLSVINYYFCIVNASTPQSTRGLITAVIKRKLSQIDRDRSEADSGVLYKRDREGDREMYVRVDMKQAGCAECDRECVECSH